MAALKFVEFSVALEASFTILVIVAPTSVLVNVVVSVPVACDVVSVIAPAAREPKVEPAVPTVELWPLIDPAERVATFELTVTLKRE